MKNVKTNEIPELLENKKITLKEAIKFIWVDIYFNPGLYGLITLDEDDLSELLIEFQKRIPHIIDEYNKTKSDFTTFLRSCLFFMKTDWKRNEMKKIAESKSLEIAIKNGTVDSAPLFDSKSDPAKMTFENTTEMQVKLKNLSKEMNEAKETALILALKACNDIDDETIEKLSMFLQKNTQELENLIANIKKTTESKQPQRELMVRRRNNSFFKKRKYLIELSQLEEDSSEYQKIQNLYQKQLKNWQKNNENLEHRYIMSPSNAEIAKALGISTRKVYYCISHAKNAETLKKYQQIFTQKVESQ